MRLTLLLPLWGMLTMVSAAKQPNIIFIMADDLGWNDVGFYNPKLKTPNMNWLAKEGIELTNHYAQPVCSP
ncbi:ARSB [Bugula neritina]|uniref:ARSB n=1 Tax=Bugula neritina TaxID=10212 RepID=A0A7J7KEJ0_BUGNE|nr:ARSB [Bugula neritina]